MAAACRNRKNGGHWSSRRKLYFWMVTPTFAILKKNGTIKVFYDFKKISTLLKNHPIPRPQSEDMIQAMEEFASATALDSNIG
jgi:hypothetical protein